MPLALPLVLVLAFWLGGPGDPNGQRGFVDLAQDSGANLAVFALFASTGFLLVVVVALFAGDPVPSEASWSSLRYLLTAPVRRERLLRQARRGRPVQPYRPALPPGLDAPGGRARVRLGALRRPDRGPLGYPVLLARLALAVLYLFVSLAVVGAVAFLLGTTTDAPLAAVGGAVVLWIVCAILDQISALGAVRQGLPGHFAFAWADLLAPGRLVGDGPGRPVVGWLHRGLLGVAVWRFLRADTPADDGTSGRAAGVAGAEEIPLAPDRARVGWPEVARAPVVWHDGCRIRAGRRPLTAVRPGPSSPADVTHRVVAADPPLTAADRGCVHNRSFHDVAVRSVSSGWARSGRRITASSSPTRAPSATVGRSRRSASTTQERPVGDRGRLRARAVLALRRRPAVGGRRRAAQAHR